MFYSTSFTAFPFVHPCFLFFHRLCSKIWLFSVQFEHWTRRGKTEVGLLTAYNYELQWPTAVCPLTPNFCHLTFLSLGLFIHQIWVMPALPACQGIYVDQVKTYEKMDRVSLKHQTNLRDKWVFIFQDFLTVSKTAGQGSIKKKKCKPE